MELRIFEAAGTSFHPKSYIVTRHDGIATAFVGSSNLTATALQHGVEWNYRVITSQDHAGFATVAEAFDSLWQHSNVRLLDADWIRQYEARRLPAPERKVGLAVEPIGPPPEPHVIQEAALSELERTRAEGNTAGLVVLATGLGKTWLSAFDSMPYRRILFIAHREEILSQALKTFRTIRPKATLGYYNGQEKAPEADVLFASIQTLGRRQHLERFDPHEFDYLVVDEFHHAAASTYRRAIGYFEPRFLLGLTATPERTDGGDLLSLCGNNLVYRCDIAEGIRKGLLSPFSYYGVPDLVDYQNIPWRNSRFDETELTAAVATESRAQNALEQLRRYGQQRVIAFCVSKRHADYMADFFSTNGLRAVAVHSGTTSAPRAHSLEKLEAGELDVICAVDMFNEGVDLPHVDTILMLRPTESRIVWVQQFGRGLRQLPGKTLSVIDYIGNHRIFLTKAKALFNLGNADREVAYALKELEAGEFDLPPGCSVTYELEAKDILRSLIRGDSSGFREYYEEYRESHASRPTAIQVFEDGFNPRAVRKGGDASWLDFVESMGDLSPAEREARQQLGGLLDQLDVTKMVKSYKMLVLLAMISENAFPGEIPIARLAARFGELARRYASIRQEIGDVLDDDRELRRLIETNPIDAWVGGAGTGGTSYFSYEDGVLSTTVRIQDSDVREAAQDLASELAEWRLIEYLRRTIAAGGAERIVCKVSHASGRPIIFLPPRDKFEDIPTGWRDIYVDNELYQANFVKIAVNVVVRPGTTENVLPQILRGWFGENAGQPGRTDTVAFEQSGDAYVLRPVGTEPEVREGPLLWNKYNRVSGLDALGLSLRNQWERQSGIVERPNQLVFFVTLDKSNMADEFKYTDRFLSPTEFEWESQNRTRQESPLGMQIRNHDQEGTEVHLFVRSKGKIRGETQDFYYSGQLTFIRWEGEKPIKVWWKLGTPVPARLWNELLVPVPPVES